MKQKQASKSRKKKTTPKWEYTTTVWTDEIEEGGDFSYENLLKSKQIRSLDEVIAEMERDDEIPEDLLSLLGKSQFETSLKKIICRYKLFSKRDKEAPNRAEIESALDKIQSESLTLLDHLSKVDSYTENYLVEALYEYSGDADRVEQIKNHLTDLVYTTSKAREEIDDSFHRKRNSTIAKAGLVQEIKSLLKTNGIEPKKSRGRDYIGHALPVTIMITLAVCKENIGVDQAIKLIE